MDEIVKYAELLFSIEAMCSVSGATGVELPPLLEDEDEETRELVMLLSRSNASLLHKAKLRACMAGLHAVNQHISRIAGA